MLTESGRSLRDFVFPPSCLVCGISRGDGRLLCPDCNAFLEDTALHYTPDRAIPSPIDSAVVLLPYDEACRNVVHALKYHGIHSIGPVLGRMMADKILRGCTFVSPPLIVPVPLHGRKLAIRGYNQAERLAQGIAAHTGFGMKTGLLARTRHTGTQTALDEARRHENVKGVFRCTDGSSLRGRPVILVDDVMTTGSTLAECAHALKDCGAAGITAAVVATPDMGTD